jgi:hypothetical protein
MRGGSHTLAAVLSLLMASTLVSGSICDLNCRMNEESLHCQGAPPRPCDSGREVAEFQGGKIPSAYRGHPVSGHCGSRQPTQDAGKNGPVKPLPSRASLPCGLRGCAQFLASTFSVPGVVSAWLGSPLIAAMVPCIQTPLGSFGRTRFESPPPPNLSIERFSGVLRI